MRPAQEARTQDARAQRAMGILKMWFREHIASPFPSEDEKMRLSTMTGLDVGQIDYWFNVARTRLKQMNPEMATYMSGPEVNRPRYVESIVHQQQ